MGPAAASSDAHQPVPLHPAFGSQAGPPLGLTRLLKEFPPPHLLFDAAAFNQFAEAADRLLNAFAIAYRQFDHEDLLLPFVLV